MAFLYAFDLLELDGQDLRREPLEVRKATLASILRRPAHGVRLNEHLAHAGGLAVFQHACKMGLEGIVSKRLGSRYRSGRHRLAQVQEPGGACSQAGGRRGLGQEGVAMTSATPRPYRWPPTWFTDLLATTQGRCICFRDRGLGRETLAANCAVRL